MTFAPQELPAPALAQAASHAPEGPPLLRIDGPIARIHLRRPSQRNTLSTGDLNALLAHCEVLGAQAGVRVVVLSAQVGAVASAPSADDTAVKPVFCAGFDIGALGGAAGGENDPTGAADVVDLFEDAVQAVANLQAVTVCALSGSVFGGATDLALACDLRLGVPGGIWRMPAAALGLHFYASGLQRAHSHLGASLAKRAFLSGQALSFEELADAGVLQLCAHSADLVTRTDALAQQISAAAPLAVQSTKRSLSELAAGSAQLSVLQARSAASRGSMDFAEGRAAWMAKRAPLFVGR